MKFKVEISERQKEILDQYLENNTVVSNNNLTHIKEVLKNNIGFMNYFEKDNDEYIEARNPLIVVLGDSVTAGYFEEIDMSKFILAQDLADGYVEKFKHMLHDKYEKSALNIINSGIAGDNMFGMYKRRYQDVFNYNPDLVIINGSLNWSKKHGDNSKFEYYLNLLIDELKEKNIETVLMTSNVCTNDETHKERIEIIRKISKEKDLALVDVYKIFEECFDTSEYESLLSNKLNHPTPYGHTIMAKALMQLFK